MSLRDRTQRTNEHRITRALGIEIDGVPLREWTYTDLRRRHVLALVDALLTDQGRSALGATHIIRALSVMTEDAITDEVADINPFKGVSVRANDPRVSKRPTAGPCLHLPADARLRPSGRPLRSHAAHVRRHRHAPG